MRKPLQVCVVAFALLLVFQGVSVCALDRKYFNSEAWNDVSGGYLVEDEWGFATAAVTTDENEGVLYTYITYEDRTVNTDDIGEIVVTYTVTNSGGSRKISCTDSEDFSDSFANVTGVFDEAFSGAHRGKIYTALEIKDKFARTQKNSIACELFYGGRHIKLFEDAELDLTVYTTVKQTAAKTVKATTTKAQKATVVNQTSVKSTAQKVTKFTGNGSFAEEAEPTADNSTTQSTTEFAVPVTPNELKTTLSTTAKITTAISAAIILVGLLLLALGLASKKKADPDAEGTDNPQENNNE